MKLCALRTDMTVEPGTFMLLYYQPKSNLANMLDYYSSPMVDVRVLAGVIVPIPYFLMLRDLFRITVGRIGLDLRARIAVTACIFAPLLLLLLGYDVLRWISFVALNCSLLVMALIGGDCAGVIRAGVSDYVLSGRFAILALLSLALGPLHVVDGNGIATGVHAVARGLGLVRW